MHTASCCLEEVPYCFSRSSIKFQGHTALKFVEFDPDWPFPDCNSSLNSTMATKWGTTRPVTAIKSLRFALFLLTKAMITWHIPRFLHIFSRIWGIIDILIHYNSGVPCNKSAEEMTVYPRLLIHVHRKNICKFDPSRCVCKISNIDYSYISIHNSLPNILKINCGLVGNSNTELIISTKGC